MVQFRTIIFFSWISSIFVGVFKSSRFFVSPCICQHTTIFIGSTFATLGTTTCFGHGCWPSSCCTWRLIQRLYRYMWVVYRGLGGGCVGARSRSGPLFDQNEISHPHNHHPTPYKLPTYICISTGCLHVQPDDGQYPWPKQLFLPKVANVKYTTNNYSCVSTYTTYILHIVNLTTRRGWLALKNVFCLFFRLVGCQTSFGIFKFVTENISLL